MKTCFAIIAAIIAIMAPASAADLPESILVTGQEQHVQGIAYDSEKNCMYMSFTSRFVKTDMQGNILASIDRIQGHLGAMTFNPVTRKVYASLECKDDEIGAGIAKTLNVKTVSRADSRFFIAIIDVDRLEGIGTDPEGNEVLRTVCIKKAVEDYAFRSKSGDFEHRYGCSGIDGVTIGPAIGKPEAARYGRRSARKPAADEKYLYVGYGIYGDTDRTDNDYQVIHRYSLKELEKYARPVIFGETHHDGPEKPEKEYFLRTGNTNYGIQNFAYDEYTDCFFLAVYKGRKADFPNYSLFAFKALQQPFKAALTGGRDKKKVLQLSLVKPEEPYFINPSVDETTGITGWRFRWGSTGLCPLGRGLWYISENGKDRETGKEYCRARLYRWSTKPGEAFVPAE